MDGGKFNLPLQDFTKHVYGFIQQKCFNIGLTFHVQDKSIVFFDIDKTNDINIDTIVIKITEECNAIFEPTSNASEAIVSKNESQPRYHVFFPNLVANKSTLKRLKTAVNNTLGFECVDSNCSTLRLDGFNKFDTNSKIWIQGSRYLPVDNSSLDESYFSKTCLLVPNRPLTVLKNSSDFNSSALIHQEAKDIEHDSNSLQSQQSQSVSNSVSQPRMHQSAALFGDSIEANSDPQMSTSRSNSILLDDTDISNIASVDEAVVKFPFLSEHLRKHDITSVKTVGNKIFFDFSKSEEDRSCPFVDRVHRYDINVSLFCYKLNWSHNM